MLKYKQMTAERFQNRQSAIVDHKEINLNVQLEDNNIDLIKATLD
jgi:hypothetical protein